MPDESILPKLEDIPEIRMGLTHYLVQYMGVSQDRLELSFVNWCKNLSEGKGLPEMRRFVVHTLLGAGYYQHQISKMLSISTRTIGRDVKKIADSLHAPRFWKKGLLRNGKLREKKLSMTDIFEKIMENVRNDKSGKYALFVTSMLKGKMPDDATN